MMIGRKTNPKFNQPETLVEITGDRAKFYGKIELEFTIGEQMFNIQFSWQT